MTVKYSKEISKSNLKLANTTMTIQTNTVESGYKYNQYIDALETLMKQYKTKLIGALNDHR